MSKDLTRAICSHLLVYPEEDFAEKRDEYLHLTSLLQDKYRKPLLEFLEQSKLLSLTELQQLYVETFDMRRKCSLFLTSWTHGDTRNRGMAIVYFSQKFKEQGLILDRKELPDHLSVVLEFAALHSGIEGEMLLAEHHSPLLLIRDALEKSNSIYVHILEAVIETLPDISDEIRARAKALAISGPPKEFVGLSGSVSVALEPFRFNTNIDDAVLEGVSQ